MRITQLLPVCAEREPCYAEIAHLCTFWTMLNASNISGTSSNGASDGQPSALFTQIVHTLAYIRMYIRMYMLIATGAHDHALYMYAAQAVL